MQIAELEAMAGKPLAAAAKAASKLDAAGSCVRKPFDAATAAAAQGGLAFLGDGDEPAVAANGSEPADDGPQKAISKRKRKSAESGVDGALHPGQKPVEERIINTALFFVVSRADCTYFRPCHEACPLFAALLKRAAQFGVRMLAHDVVWRTNGKCYAGKPLEVKFDKGVNDDLDTAWLADVVEAATVFEDGRPPPGWQPKSDFLNTRAVPRKKSKSSAMKSAPAGSLPEVDAAPAGQGLARAKSDGATAGVTVGGDKRAPKKRSRKEKGVVRAADAEQSTGDKAELLAEGAAVVVADAATVPAKSRKRRAAVKAPIIEDSEEDSAEAPEEAAAPKKRKARRVKQGSPDVAAAKQDAVPTDAAPASGAAPAGIANGAAAAAETAADPADPPAQKAKRMGQRGAKAASSAQAASAVVADVSEAGNAELPSTVKRTGKRRTENVS
jgi:Sugar fermentation stimulation protein RE domain